MLSNLLEIEYGFTLEMIQCCPIGTAFVRVTSFADRDWLVNQSPDQFAGRTISFVNHNEGINHRAFTYNQECWLLLIAYPLDLWNSEHIKRAVRDFGVFVAWGEEASCYGAIVVKVRVADLQHIPHSCVVTDGNTFQGESWTVPIFILSQKLLGNLPADEDDPLQMGPHLTLYPCNLFNLILYLESMMLCMFLLLCGQLGSPTIRLLMLTLRVDDPQV
jgi:hypothetical protein